MKLLLLPILFFAVSLTALADCCDSGRVCGEEAKKTCCGEDAAKKMSDCGDCGCDKKCSKEASCGKEGACCGECGGKEKKSCSAESGGEKAAAKKEAAASAEIPKPKMACCPE